MTADSARKSSFKTSKHVKLSSLPANAYDRTLAVCAAISLQLTGRHTRLKLTQPLAVANCLCGGVRPHTKPFSGLPLRALLSDLGSSDEAQQSTAEAVERGLHEDEARLRAQVQARLEAEKTDPSLVRPNRGVWVCTSGL